VSNNFVTGFLHAIGDADNTLRMYVRLMEAKSGKIVAASTATGLRRSCRR